MPTSLSKEHRRILEKVTSDARLLAELACKAALENLAVHEKTFRSHMSDEQKLLRNRLRARGRALGDKRDERSGTQDIRHLSELAAYEHWHRLLFTRFLTENQLLITDVAYGAVPITLEECEELAAEFGARDGFELACSFASRTLPGVFRRDDPVLNLSIAINDQVELRKLLATLPSEVFHADDALGWTYQFWQAQRKEEINRSDKKIGADELSPVTQLFTEDYIVEFLLHNTLGAWWAGKIGPIKGDSEEEARAQAALTAREGVPAILWTYLRFVKDEATKTWLPAAGTFNGWPKSASLIRLIDPCMGSGHFLVFALPLLVRLRMEEEKLNTQAAVVEVLKDNIHGLELDERCTQIAAFNVALTAWKLGGYQALPSLNLACSGIAPSATEVEWVSLAGDNERARTGIARMHSLFKDAPMLGSLVNPRTQGGNLLEAEFYELAPLLEKALAREAEDENAHEVAVTARGVAKAAELLASQFTLIATNVPFLSRGKQDSVLRDFCESAYQIAKGDLATALIQRCLEFLSPGGSVAIVSPEQWFFTKTYSTFRKELLQNVKWNLVARFGPAAFQIMNWWAARTVAFIVSQKASTSEKTISVVDLPYGRKTDEKPSQLLSTPVLQFSQEDQLKNPEHRLKLSEKTDLALLSEHAISVTGLQTGDNPAFICMFWEQSNLLEGWTYQQRTVSEAILWGGREQILYWQDGKGILVQQPGVRINCASALGKKGIAVHRMANLRPTLFSGEVLDQNAAAIVPINSDLIPAIWEFISSSEYAPLVRELDTNTGVAPATLVQVPFDLTHWQTVAAEKYPHGLPKPVSSNPTQWLFNGHPNGSEQSLHVAVARLLGYRWPRQTGSSFLDCPAIGPDGLESFADHDGIVCLPPVNREQPAAARLRHLLTAALGTFDERALIAAAGLKGSKSKTIEDWLRDEFFEQHAKLFHDRPFIWHLWDGRPDGFHALVNYHLLDHATLQKLTYSHLGNWIQQQSDDTKADKPGAAARLGAARALQAKLAAILEGEAPLDIFVRWKPLKEQSQGWYPDLNDGVRQNIRPFLLAGDVGKKGAGLFRTVPLKLNDKDRGTEPTRPKSDYPWFWCAETPGTDPAGGKDFVGSRWNNVHLTLAHKQKAKA